MPRQPTTIEMRLNNISTCVAITANTLDVLVKSLKISSLEAISNTTQSLLKMVKTIKQDKTKCAELMEHIHQLLNAIIGVYIKSDAGAELLPSVLNEILKFIKTLHKIHTFVEAQQSGSKVKNFFRQGELNALLKDCKTGLQQGITFFQIKMTADVLGSAREMQDQAQLRHQEVLDIIETVTSSDSASSISTHYSDSYASSNSISMLPAEPKIFHGRDTELADILKLFNQGTPRIAILGAGGMGKTSLARTVLHHEEITTRYHANRFFIACDSATSKGEFASLIGAHLGIELKKDLAQAVLWHFSNAPPSLLILDNLETVWEPVKSRKEIEEFLSLLTDITSLALVVTMRGAERPAKVQWSRPFLLPLQPLVQNAAQKMFIDIADDRHSMEEVDQVLQLTDNMPVSISLLAHLVDMEGCTEILSRWEIEKTSLISEGHDRKSNLELSISLSLTSPRMTSMPHSQDLLALLSILPDGLLDVELMQSKFPMGDILGCKAALLRTALAYTDDHKRLKVLVPVREYMRRLYPPTEQMVRPLLKHFEELLDLYTTNHGKESGAFLFARLTSNYTNIQNTLQSALHSDHPDLPKIIHSTCDFNKFSNLAGRGQTPLMDEITSLLPYLEDPRLKVYLSVAVFTSWRYQPISHPETLIAQVVESFTHLDDPDLKSGFYNALGSYYSEHDIPTALKYCQVALALGKSSGNLQAQHTAQFRLAHLAFSAGNYAASRGCAQEVQRLARISGDLYTETLGLYTEAVCLQSLGNYSHCISLITRASVLLDLCGMSQADINYSLMNCQAEVHKLKSEYFAANSIQSRIHQKVLVPHDPYRYALALASIAEVEVLLGTPNNEIQRKIGVSKGIFMAIGSVQYITACDVTQADLNLREGDMSSLLFCKCLREARGKDVENVSYCLERLGDVSSWRSHHDPSWTTVFLAHAIKMKQRLELYKALQFIGDIFLQENDEVTAISLFTLALEGFTQMDVHRSRAECMIRLGDISKKNNGLLRAVEFWEMARPLFERSSQAKR